MADYRSHEAAALPETYGRGDFQALAFPTADLTVAQAEVFIRTRVNAEFPGDFVGCGKRAL
jgi:hypothetical protein